MPERWIFTIDRTLVFLIALAIAGGACFLEVPVGPASIYGIRIFIILALIWLAASRGLRPAGTRFSAAVLGVLLFWIVYGCLSLYWTPSKIAGIKELANVAFGVAIYVVIRSLWVRIDDFPGFFTRCWNLVFTAVLLFAAAEILTASHLPGSYVREVGLLGRFHPVNHVPVAFFDNPNHFAFYLVTGVLLNCVAIFRRRHIGMACFVILSSAVLIAVTDSRLALYCLMLVTLAGAVYYAALHLRRWRRPAVGLLATLAVTAAVIFALREAGGVRISPSVGEPLYVVLKETAADTSLHSRLVPVSVDLAERLTAGESGRVRFAAKGKWNFLMPGNPSAGSFLWFTFLLGATALALMIATALFLKKKGPLRFSLLAAGVFAALFCSVHLRQGLSVPEPQWTNHLLLGEAEQQRPSTVLMEIPDPVFNALAGGTQLTLRAFPADLKGEASDGLRKQLAMNGLHFLRESRFLGAGAGSFQPLMQQGKGMYPAGNLSDPHSLAIEVLAQYGLPVGIPLALLFGFIVAGLAVMAKRRFFTRDYFALTLFIPCFMLLGNANSTSLSLPLTWLTIALIVAGFERLITERNE